MRRVRYTGHMLVIGGEQLNKYLPVVLLVLVTACDSDRNKPTTAPVQTHATDSQGRLDIQAADEDSEAAKADRQVRIHPLDLTIPDQQLSVDEQEHHAEGALLPDLFSQQGNSASQQSRTSVGGRLVLDENNPDYSMEAVKGAEVTVEVLTP